MRIAGTMRVAMALACCLGLVAVAGASAPVPRLQRVQPIRPAVVAAPDLLQRVREAEAGRIPLRDLTVGESLRLDVRNGNVGGVARLEFQYPQNVSAADNAARFEPLGDYPSRIKLELKAPEAAAYVAELTFDAGAEHGGEGARELLFETLGGAVQAAPIGTGPQRRLFLIEAQPGWNLMLIRAGNAAWTFRSIEITRLR